MDKIIYIVRLDMIDTAIKNTGIRLKQFDDDVELQIEVTKNGEELILSNETVNVFFKKNDGTTVIGEPTKVDSNVVYYDFNGHELTERGRLYFDVKIGADGIVSTQSAVIDVVDGTNTGKIDKSSVNYNDIIIVKEELEKEIAQVPDYLENIRDTANEGVKEVDEAAQKWIDEFPDEAELTGKVKSLDKRISANGYGEYAGGNTAGETSNIVDGYYADTNGSSVVENEAFWRTEKTSLCVNPLTTYTLNLDNGNVYTIWLANADGECTERITGSLPITLTTSENTAYLRVSGRKSNGIPTKIWLNEGITSLPYEPYYPSNKMLSEVTERINDSLGALEEEVDKKIESEVATDFSQADTPQFQQTIDEALNEVNELKSDLSDEQTAREQSDTSLQQDISGKLPKSPADWETWTVEEQAAARERIGLEKPWVLKGTLTTENKDTGCDVNFIGCTELLIKGTTTGIGGSLLSIGDMRMVRNVSSSGTVYFVSHIIDTEFGIKVDFTYTGSKSDEMSAHTILPYFPFRNPLFFVENATQVYFSSPDNITTCKIEIYAR